MKRIMSLLLAVALIIVLAVPVSADQGSLGGWTDLLESTSVNPDGTNLVKINGSEGTFDILVDPQRRISKVDILFSYGNGSLPSYIGVDYAGDLTQLTVVDLGDNLARAYGNLTYAFYPSLCFTVRKDGTGAVYYDLLSCKISTIKTTDKTASGTLRRSFSDPDPLTLPNNFTVEGVYEEPGYKYLLVPVTITDWRKFDTITLFGSISKAALNSFRASIGNKGLPYTISYMESIPTGEYEWGYYSHEWFASSETNYLDTNDEYSDIPEEMSKEDGFAAGDFDGSAVITYGGSILYTVTIDLTGIDRTTTGNLDCFFTCIAENSIGYAFNVQNASGSVIVADRTAVTWWNRFASFMTDLFGGDTEKADQFQDDMQEANDALTDANEQIDAVTKPAVDDVPIDPSIYLDADGTAQAGQIVQTLLGNDLVLPMASITLIVGLAAFIIF